MLEEYLMPDNDKYTDAKIDSLRSKLDGAYKESIELGSKDFKKGDGIKELRQHIEKALSNYKWRLMEVMRFQMLENNREKRR
jgi:selenocysteine-specific translation elongation factor